MALDRLGRDAEAFQLLGEVRDGHALSGRALRLDHAVAELEVGRIDLQLARSRTAGARLEVLDGRWIARPAEYVTTEPPLIGERGADDVSDATMLMRLGWMPSVSAAIVAKPDATPLMSTTPVMTVTVPSPSRRHIAAAGSLPPGQTPRERPTPSPAGRFLRSLPQRMVGQAAGPPGAEADPRLAVDHRVAGDDGVALAQRDRVDIELRGDLVEQALERERRLRAARSAVRAGADAVRLGRRTP